MSPKHEETFQTYDSVRESVRTITPEGFRITFTAYRYITQNKEAIEFLDHQIKLKALPGITKGKQMTTSDLNPQEVLRKKYYAEFLAEQADNKAKEAMGISRDMGSTDNKVNISPASSSHIPADTKAAAAMQTTATVASKASAILSNKK